VVHFRKDGSRSALAGVVRRTGHPEWVLVEEVDHEMLSGMKMLPEKIRENIRVVVGVVQN